MSSELINIRGQGPVLPCVTPSHLNKHEHRSWGRGTGNNSLLVSLTFLEFVKGFALMTLVPAVDHIWVKLISLHIPFSISPGHLDSDHTSQPAL